MHPEHRRALIVRTGPWTCALPLEDVEETLRPLPVTPVAGAPVFLRGLAVVRGAPAPVVSLVALLGGAGSRAPRRFVSLRLPGRRLVLEVDEVLGLRTLEDATLEAVPSLVETSGGHLEALGTLDGQLLAFLSAARLLPDEVWAQLSTDGGGAR